jgi:glycosyltransferase involved in cell wall biosynthesis
MNSEHPPIRSASSRLPSGAALLRTLQGAWRVFQRSGWRGVKWEIRRRLGRFHDYTRWVRRYDTLAPEARNRLVARVATMRSHPLISVLMPTYNPDPAWLREAIESVRAQIYPHWELCIADDASPSAEVRDVLRSYAETDARIKVVLRPENGHISAASNSALALASGSWLALMDHDDLLPEHALYWVAECVDRHPDVRLIYSDEDKVDDQGHRFGAYFKPDWNIDLFRSQNMFSHLGVLATDLVREVGGFRAGLEGSQDWDLVLRCVERVRADQVRHVPRVLYHWRVHEASTAQSMNAKPYAALAGERALNEHFVRTGVRATAEYVNFGYRVRYALPEPAPLVSVIVVARNGIEALRRCVESIVARTTYPRYEIIVVDSGSDGPVAPGYFESLARYPNIRVLRREGDFNDAALNNFAVGAANGELVALVGKGVEVIAPDWLSQMVSLALQEGVGAVGARLWHPDKALQHAGVLLGLGGVAANAHEGLPPGEMGYGGRAALIQSFSAVSAACMVVRKTAYQEVGGLDEAHLQEAFGDVDFCLKLRRAGLRNAWTPYADVLNHEPTKLERTASLQPRLRRDTACMQERWGDLLLNDPAYNPNLGLMHGDFSYAWPPRLEGP